MIRKIDSMLKQMTDDNTDYSYKILLPNETDWLENYPETNTNTDTNTDTYIDIETGPLQNLNMFNGNAKDIRSGFIHMCGNIEQIHGIIKKHYLNTCPTVIQLDNRLMYPNVKFEHSDSMGDTYPHMYSALSKSHVVKRVDFTDPIAEKDLPNLMPYLKNCFNV